MVGSDVDARSAEITVGFAAGLAVAVGERDSDGVVLVAVAGALDLATAGQLWETLDRVFRGPTSRVAVDAAAVGTVDRAGLLVLENAAERAEDWGVPFAVGGLQRRFPALVQRSASCLVHRDVDHAIRAVRERFLPGEPTRVDLLQENADLRSALDRSTSS